MHAAFHEDLKSGDLETAQFPHWNPKFRNRKLDCPGFQENLPRFAQVQFTVSKFRVSNAGIVQFRDRPISDFLLLRPTRLAKVSVPDSLMRKTLAGDLPLQLGHCSLKSFDQ